MKLDPKGLEAAIAAWSGQPVNTPVEAVMEAAIAAYLSALTPAEAGELVERLRGTHTCDGCGEYVGSTIHDLCDEAADKLEELAAENKQLEKDLRTVQNAAKTLASAQGTELEHRRRNADYDHKLRTEHESLIERDAVMTDALLKAEDALASERAAHAETKRELDKALNRAEIQWAGWVKEQALHKETKARLAEALKALEPDNRHEDRLRNVIINVASSDLENIINGHDPDVSILANDVWDRLDKMACEIEARAARRVREGGKS